MTAEELERLRIEYHGRRAALQMELDNLLNQYPPEVTAILCSTVSVNNIKDYRQKDTKESTLCSSYGIYVYEFIK